MSYFIGELVVSYLVEEVFLEYVLEIVKDNCYEGEGSIVYNGVNGRDEDDL